MFNLKIKFKNKILLLIILFITLFFFLFLSLDILFVSRAYKKEVQLQNVLVQESIHTFKKDKIKNYNQFLTDTAFYAIKMLMIPINDISSSVETIARQFVKSPELPNKMLDPKARYLLKSFYIPMPANSISEFDRKNRYSYWAPDNTGEHLLNLVSDKYLITVESCRILQYSFGPIIKNIFVITKNNLVAVLPPLKNISDIKLTKKLKQLKQMPWKPSFQWTKDNNLLLWYTGYDQNSGRELTIAVKIDYNNLTSFLYDYLVQSQLDNILVVDKNGRIVAVQSQGKNGSLNQLLLKGNNIYQIAALHSMKKHLMNKDSGSFSFTDKNATKYQLGFCSEKDLAGN